MTKEIIYCILLFVLGQVLVWFQLNGQFLWDSFRKYEGLLILTGIPITWIFIEATRQGYTAFNGLLWPARFIGFGIGIAVYALCVSFFMNEGITMKTFISLILCFIFNDFPKICSIHFL